MVIPFWHSIVHIFIPPFYFAFQPSLDGIVHFASPLCILFTPLSPFSDLPLYLNMFDNFFPIPFDLPLLLLLVELKLELLRYALAWLPLLDVL